MYSLIALMGNTVSSDAAATAAPGSSGSSILFLVIMLLVFYFLLIRPQKKRDKEAKEMLASLKRGDKIVTIGGIRGTVATVRENTVVIKVEDDVKIEFNKTAISSILSRSEDASVKKESEEIVAAPKVEEKKPAKRASKKVAKEAEEKKEEEAK